MNIDQTKCDHCGKVHDTPNRSFRLLDKTDLLSVPLKVNGKAQYLDFCGEDCLRDELIKRNGASAPNENKMSCCERGRALLRDKG